MPTPSANTTAEEPSPSSLRRWSSRYRANIPPPLSRFPPCVKNMRVCAPNMSRRKELRPRPIRSCLLLRSGWLSSAPSWRRLLRVPQRLPNRLTRRAETLPGLTVLLRRIARRRKPQPHRARRHRLPRTRFPDAGTTSSVWRPCSRAIPTAFAPCSARRKAAV